MIIEGLKLEHIKKAYAIASSPESVQLLLWLSHVGTKMAEGTKARYAVPGIAVERIESLILCAEL
jgi:hypothetical protein